MMPHTRWRDGPRFAERCFLCGQWFHEFQINRLLMFGDCREVLRQVLSFESLFLGYPTAVRLWANSTQDALVRVCEQSHRTLGADNELLGDLRAVLIGRLTEMTAAEIDE